MFSASRRNKYSAKRMACKYSYFCTAKGMKVQLIVVGKTTKQYLKEAMAEYVKRLGRYVKFELIELPDVKVTPSWPTEKVRQAEAEKILTRVTQSAQLFLLDERGQALGSVEFAQALREFQDRGIKDLCFVVAGAHGAHKTLKARANKQLSISKMTFSHQIIRPLFLEQLYRAFTILRGEPYHNEG